MRHTTDPRKRVRRPSVAEVALTYLAGHAVGDRYTMNQSYSLAHLIWLYSGPNATERHHKLVGKVLLERLNGYADVCGDGECGARERNRREAFIEQVHIELANLEAAYAARQQAATVSA